MASSRWRGGISTSQRQAIRNRRAAAKLERELAKGQRTLFTDEEARMPSESYNEARLKASRNGRLPNVRTVGGNDYRVTWGRKGITVRYDPATDKVGIVERDGSVRYVSKYSHEIPSGVRNLAREQYVAEERKAANRVMKDPTERYGRRHGRPTGIAYTYSPRSKVMPRPKGLVAVRMRGGERGWYKEGIGRFASEEDFKLSLRGVDHATNRRKYERIWDDMTPEQRARFVERSADIDWDEFWELHYDPSTGYLDRSGEEMITEMINYALNG